MKKLFKNLKELVKQHILNNKREYFIVSIIFIVGIFLGVIFINQANESQIAEIKNYLTNFVEQLKNTKLDTISLLKNSLKRNSLIAILLCFFGTTVIGIPMVFGILLYRGFCLGYTISACVSCFGTVKGSIFIVVNSLFPSLLFLPAMLAIAVSGMKLYKSIIKDKQKENIKPEILRHILFSFIMLLIIYCSSFIETFISCNILKYIF